MLIVVYDHENIASDIRSTFIESKNTVKQRIFQNGSC